MNLRTCRVTLVVGVAGLLVEAAGCRPTRPLTAAALPADPADGAPAAGSAPPGMSGMPTGAMPMKAMPMQTAEPSPATQALLAKIRGYRSWPNFPENTAPKFSKSHMNMYVLAFHNGVVGKAMKKHTLPVPDGALIVKENMAKPTDPKPTSLTTMSKQAGKWYWAETTPDGKVVLMDGKPLEGTDVPGCVGCHVNAEANDYIYTHKLK